MSAAHPAPRAVARRALAPALAAAWLLGTMPGALAQQTVIIGGGPAAPRPSGGAIVGAGGSGVVVNDSVLDSLGPGAPAAGVPLAAPQTPVYNTWTPNPAAPGATAPGAKSPGGTGAYRLPGSGQLVVTRPATLLYPPMQAPQSHLALPRPSTAAAAKPAPADSAGKLPSRLIAAPPKQRLAAPAPKAMAAAPRTPPPVRSAPIAAAKPADSGTKAPAMPAVPTPKAMARTQPEVPAKPSVPPPPSLAKEIQDEPAIAATIAPAPPPAPTVAAPTVAAPRVAAPAPAAPAPAPAVQQASRTAGVADKPAGGDLRLTFEAGSADLSDAARQELLVLAQDLARDASSRIQLLAYAADDGTGASKARRLSLSRALAVRAFLIEQGVRSTRMDVRALGSKVDQGPADRVDVTPQ